MASDPRRIQGLFLKIAELPPDDRTAALDRECGDDVDLRGRIEALLQAHDEPGSSLTMGDARFDATAASGAKEGSHEAGVLAQEADGGSADPRHRATAVYTRHAEPGVEIAGRYKLLEKIGEGGMGDVWVARQTAPVKRRVALKLIKTGMDSRAVLARFEQERQALAMMEHPNIARVLDAGMTSGGQPFFVMELVNGLPLTKYCDEARLTPKERLELFVPICQAVQHAHQKGIVHRDLKPANILVTLVDGKAVPMVIDFGVAKATAGKLTDETLSTGFGAVVGTLEYMSPEQAGFSNVDVDTRADIYSLGVILYELLTGLRPIDAGRLKKAALAEMMRIIQEEEPSTPSTRLSTDESLRSMAALRQTDPRKLMSLLRGELDWVVMKCLEKSRERRYETASALGRDIQRYLADEPVEARPPSARYRMQKFVRRNKGRVIAASLVLLTLVGGIAGTTLGLLKAERALRAEARQRNIAERVAEERERARATAEYEKDQKEAARAAAADERDQKERARASAERALYFNRVNLAAQYWQSSNLAESRRMLDLCAPQGRGWEWRYLDRLHRADLLTLPGNGQFTTGLKLSKDGHRLAAFSPWGFSGARIWDLTNGKPLGEIGAMDIKNQRAYGRQFTCCALAPDGRIIAMGDKSGAIDFWDAETGQISREFKKLPGAIGTLSFSPDGTWLAAARADGRNGEMLSPMLEPPRNEDLVVWEVASGAEACHPRGFGFMAEFSPDGTRLLTYKMNRDLRLTSATPETSVAILDTSNWKEVNAGQWGSADCFSFSANGRILALGGHDRIRDIHFVRFVDASTAKELSALSPVPLGTSSDIALSPDGSTLALNKGLSFGEIEIWDGKTGRRVRSLRGHVNTVNNMIYTPEGKLLSCSWDHTIKIWDPAIDPEVRQVLPPCLMQSTEVVLAPGGQVLAFSEPNTVSILTGPLCSITLVKLGVDRPPPPETGGIIPELSRTLFGAASNDRTLAGNTGGTVAIAFSNNGRHLASGGRKGEVKAWDLTSMALLSTYRGHNGKITALAISSDGRRVASANEPPEVAKWQARQAQLPSAPIPVAVEVWDAESGHALFTFDSHGYGVGQLAFSGDGRLLASASGSETRIVDMASGKLLRELNPSEYQSGTTDDLAFSAAGNLLATAGNNVVQLWDVASGHSVAAFHGHKAGKLRVAISPDQSRLASAAGEQVKIWDVQSGLEALSLPLPQLRTNEGPAVFVTSLAWSADGQRLRAALSNGSVVEWDATDLAHPTSLINLPA